MVKLSSLTPNIIEEENVYDDHLLDIFGSSFKFDHSKGICEWLKNSVDAYRRIDVPDKNQYVILRLSDGVKNDALIELIDFVGMDQKDIRDAFKRWGDPKAAKRRLRKLTTYGGHGSGGKFYMRQMFDYSYFVTYRDGNLNIFGFSKNKRYGFDKEFKDKKILPKEALRIANIDKILFPTEIKNKILNKETGFTVVKGITPVGMKNKIKLTKIIEKFKNHPQSRHILSRINVSVIYNDKIVYDLIRPDEIKPLEGFEDVRIIPVPERITISQRGEKEEIILASNKYPAGRLILRTSEMAFERNSRFEDLNRIDIIGGLGVVASYHINNELGVKNFPQAAFIYGECKCPILEDPENYVITNDRSKLVENKLTRFLLQWISDQIDKLAEEITLKEQKEMEKIKTEISSNYNKFLNEWKNRFMKKILSTVLGKGVEENGESIRGRIKRKLEAPKDLEFSFSFAKIPINEESQLTLKARVPEPIPIGSRVSLNSDTSFIGLKENQITIKSEDIKKTSKGEEVGIINAYVIGRRIGERGQIKAEVGKYNAEIEVEVIESKSGQAKRRKPQYPTVLLSGIDKDPLGIFSGEKFIIDSRQPLVYQRRADFEEGIYWINTSAPFASFIRKKYGTNSLQWRNYLFQRYVDIFVKEAIFELQRKDPESFRAERIDSEILGKVVYETYLIAEKDLKQFLFEEEYEPGNPEEKKISK